MKRLNKNIFYSFFFVVLSSLACDKEISITEFEPKILNGFVYLESIPGGASIYVNGTNTGQTTPDSIKWLEYGSNKFILRVKYYRDSTFILNIEENRKEYLTFDFTKNPAMRGAVSLATTPTGATVIYNDSVLGNVTPLTIKNLLPGKHKFYLKNTNCRYDSVIAEVTSNKTAEVNKMLNDTTLLVTYNSLYSDIPSVNLTCIGVDKQNDDKWIGSESQGIFIFNEKEWKVLDGSNSPLPADNIYCILVDDDNSKWIGTYTGGIAKYDGLSWQIYNKYNSYLPSNYISSIRKSPENDIWVTMPGFGFAKFDGTNWITFTKDNSALPTNEIYDIAFDDRKNIYLAAKEDCGIIKYDGKTFDIIVKGLAKCVVWKSDILYAGFTGEMQDRVAGIKRLLKEIWYNPVPVVINHTNTFAFDKINNLYVGSPDEGFTVIDPSFVNIHYYSTKNSPLDADCITGIAYDSRNVKWISTLGGGLIKYKLTK